MISETQSAETNFCAKFAAAFQVHVFDKYIGNSAKRNLNFYRGDRGELLAAKIIHAASTGDVKGIEHLINLGGVDLLNRGDYDGRTALHLACAEGNIEVMNMILRKRGVNLSPRDSWGNTPLEEAKKSERTDIVGILSSAMEKAAKAKAEQEKEAQNGRLRRNSFASPRSQG